MQGVQVQSLAREVESTCCNSDPVQLNKYFGASLVAQIVKNLPAMWETRDQPLDQEDLPEKGTHSSILAWRIPWTEEPGGVQSMGSQRATNTLTFKITHLTHLAVSDRKLNTLPADGFLL